MIAALGCSPIERAVHAEGWNSPRNGPTLGAKAVDYGLGPGRWPCPAMAGRLFESEPYAVLVSAAVLRAAIKIARLVKNQASCGGVGVGAVKVDQHGFGPQLFRFVGWRQLDTDTDPLCWSIGSKGRLRQQSRFLEGSCRQRSLRTCRPDRSTSPQELRYPYVYPWGLIDERSKDRRRHRRQLFSPPRKSKNTATFE